LNLNVEKKNKSFLTSVMSFEDSAAGAASAGRKRSTRHAEARAAAQRAAQEEEKLKEDRAARHARHAAMRNEVGFKHLSYFNLYKN
jgi:hypothetical protein